MKSPALAPFLLCLFVFLAVIYFRRGRSVQTASADERPIIFITSSTLSYTRIADLTILGNTLRLISNLLWIFVDDNDQKLPILEELLRNSGVSFVYLHKKGNNSGWAQRNEALEYIRKSGDLASDSVVYFGDVEYSYDTRFFDGFLKSVSNIGIWQVGRDMDGKQSPANSTTFNYFDIANIGFALSEIRKSNATFSDCGLNNPDFCFLKELKMKKEEVEFFSSENGREYYVWHSPHEEPFILNKIDFYNYVAEYVKIEKEL